MSTMIQNPNEIEAFTRRQRALARIHRNIAEKFQLNRRQFISGSLATMALAALGLSGCAPKTPAASTGDAAPAFTPGTYEATAQGRNGEIKVSVTFEADRIASIEADAHLTGAVKGAAVDAVDEPATVIVMHRYAEMLEDLAPAASPAAAARARAEVARVRGLYDQLDGIARRAARWDEGEDDMEGEESPAAPSLSDQFHQMRETHDAVEDVQAQALVRELQLIKAMVADDSIDAAHAKDLRNDVYIQQLVLD